MGLIWNISFWMTAGRNRKQIHRGVSAFSTYASFKMSLLGNVCHFMFRNCKYIPHNYDLYLSMWFDISQNDACNCSFISCNWNFISYNVISYLTFVTLIMTSFSIMWIYILHYDYIFCKCGIISCKCNFISHKCN